MSNHTHTDTIFTASACLSEQELGDYCRGKLSTREQHRMERHLTDCALCSAAVAAFAATPAALGDLPGLKKSLAAKAGGMAGKVFIWSGTTIIGAFAIVGLISAGVAIKYVFFTDTNKAQPTAQVQPAPAAQAPPVETNTASGTMKMEERFIRPGAPVRKTETPVVAITPVDTQKKKTIEVDSFLPVPTPVVNTVAPAAADAEKEIETIERYNAPVVYIRDLKITDFEKYYRQKITIQPERLSGVPAKFDDKPGHITDPADPDAVRIVTADQVLDEALNYFNKGRFGKCISQFDLLLNHNPNDVNAQFYIAVCNVRLEMYGRALPLLDQVLASPNNVFHQEAQWYKALALIGKGERENAKVVLQQIVDKKGFYKKQAKEKLAQLN